MTQHQAQLWVQLLAHGHSDTVSGGAGDQTVNIMITILFLLSQAVSYLCLPVRTISSSQKDIAKNTFIER